MKTTGEFEQWWSNAVNSTSSQGKISKKLIKAFKEVAWESWKEARTAESSILQGQILKLREIVGQKDEEIADLKNRMSNVTIENLIKNL